MNITTDERSNAIFSAMGSKSPISSDATFIDYPILTPSTLSADRFAKGIPGQETAAGGACFQRFAFRSLPVFGGDGLWFSEHLDAGDARFGRAWRIYTAAFADFERRTYLDQMTIHSHPRYRFSALMSGDSVVGVLACWSLSGFWLVEHFAVDADRRSAGFGGRAIRLLQEHVKGAIVLDVEPIGADPHAGRRMAFYERLGFHFCGAPVTLPPYEGCPPAPSHLMAWPHALDAERRARTVAAIECEVYGLKAAAPRARAV